MRFLFLLVTLLCLQPATALAAPGAVVRMASLQNDLHHLPLWVAQEKGFFAKEGVAVEQTATFRAGPELMAAMVAGSLDMGYVGEAPATITFARGNTAVHLVAQVNTGGSALVVAPASAATSLADLRGGRVAVPGNGTVQDFLLRRALRTSGMKADDIRIITLAPSEMAAALKGGQIDGFIAWQPFPARAVVRGEGRILADSADLWPGHPCCGLVATQAAIDRGDAVKVVRAHMRAVAFIQANPDEAVRIAMRRTGMDEQTVREAFGHVAYTPTPALTGEEEYVRFLNEFGYIQQPDSAAFTKSFIHSLVN